MRRIIVSSLLFLCLVITAQAKDKAYTVDNIPKVHLQDRTRYVCDPSGILSQEATSTMDNLLYDLERQTGIETVVAVVPSIGDADCFDFSHELLNTWGVGKKGKDNGLVILLVTDQRCVQFYTGYGLEGVLPDAICKRIQTQTMIPYLKDGNWSEGMVAGIHAVYRRLDGSMKNDNKEGSNNGEIIIVTIVMAILTFIFGIVFLSVWKSRKCPQCGKHQLQCINSRVLFTVDEVKTEKVTYWCRNCGHELNRKRKIYITVEGSGDFGGFGDDSSGGGSSGGSFGGGSGGGGGAGSHF